MDGFLGISWKAVGISAEDPMIAVSSSHVVVNANGGIGFYTKAGTQVGLIGHDAFFGSAGLVWAASETGSESSYGDSRLIFDHYRRRFWVLATYNAGNKKLDMASWPPFMFAVAVSKSEDPTQGWWSYKFHATPLDASGNYDPNQAMDFPMIGISSEAFYITNTVYNLTGPEPADGSHDATIVADTMQTIVVDAQGMADGPSILAIKTVIFTSDDFGLTPVVHMGSVPESHNLQPPLFVSRKDLHAFTLYRWNGTVLAPGAEVTIGGQTPAVGDPLSSVPQKGPESNGVQPNISMGIGNKVLSAHWRDGTLLVTTTDAIACGTATCTAARVVWFRSSQVDGLFWSLIATDQVIECASDSAGSCYHYIYPACAVNKFGDVGVVTLRSNQNSFPELRVSALYADTDAGASVSLRAGQSTAPDSSIRDLFGACVDPGNDAHVWVVGACTDGASHVEYWVGQLFSAFGGKFGLDTAVIWRDDPARDLKSVAYFFKGSQYLRYSITDDKVEQNPLPILHHWPGLGEAFPDGIDAAVVWPDDPVRHLKNVAYFFKGNRYLRYSITDDKVEQNPLPILHHWPGLGEAFPDGIDAVVVWNNGEAYFFKGSKYIRYDIAADHEDGGGPHDIGGNWRGL